MGDWIVICKPCPWVSQVHTPNHCTILSPFLHSEEVRGSGRIMLVSSQGGEERLQIPSVGRSDGGFSLLPL